MPIDIGDLRLYNVHEVADLLHIQEKTIRRYLGDGTLHGRKLVGRWHIAEPDLQAFFVGQSGTDEESQASAEAADR